MRSKTTVKLTSIISKLHCFTVVILVLLLTGCTSTVTQNVHLKYGNPSGANNNPNNYLIVKSEYALSYNCSAGTANWVSWQLDHSWLGRIERSDDFRPDLELPEGCYAIRPNDYRGSGYDRGHLIPSGDRTRSKSDNSSTFIMTNIIPQSPSNNREVWRELEEYSRNLASAGKELYLVAGGNGILNKIAKSQVIVPEFTWKVILILDPANSEITAENARTLAVWMPNSEAVRNSDWQEYIVSVDEVEKKTGYNFFANLPNNIERQLEKASYQSSVVNQSPLKHDYKKMYLNHSVDRKLLNQMKTGLLSKSFLAQAAFCKQTNQLHKCARELIKLRWRQ